MTNWNPRIITVFVHDDNAHSRNINTPMMGRTYYRTIEVEGRENLEAVIDELIAKGETITEVCTMLGTRLYRRLDGSRLY